MNITEVQMAFNRQEPGQSPGDRTTKIILLVISAAMVLGCIYILRNKIKIKKKPDKEE